jgi:hypothetical protein
MCKISFFKEYDINQKEERQNRREKNDIIYPERHT